MRDENHMIGKAIDTMLPPVVSIFLYPVFFVRSIKTQLSREMRSDSLNRSNSTSMGMIPHSGAAATLSPLPEVFLLKQ